MQENNKGQITLFIILGIVILALISLIVFLRSDLISDDEIEMVSEISLELIPVKNYLGSCLSDLTQRAVKEISLQGGYYFVPYPNFLLNQNYIPYYYINNNTNIPTKEIIEKELSDFLNEYIPYCSDSYNVPGTNITGFNISTKISGDVVTSSQDYKIIIKDSVSNINIVSSFKSPLMDFHNASKEIIGSFEQYDALCLSCLVRTAEKHNLTIDYSYVYNNTLLFALNKNLSETGMISFNFIVEQKSFEAEESIEESVVIDKIENQQAAIGYKFSYKVEAEGANLKYYDYTDLFDIDLNKGEINFTPEEEDIGIYFIEIKVNDKDGNYAVESFILEVIHVLDIDFNIECDDNLVLFVGEDFQYNINATNENISKYYFLDNTELFNISINEGYINFTPQEKDTGDYAIEIKVINKKGAFKTKTINLEIIE